MKIQGGFGSAGAGNRTGRRIATRAGISTTAKERNRRQERAAHDIKFDENPPKDILMNFIEAGRCYWCDDGRTFKSLSQHLTRAHGIDLQWLRDYLLLPKKYSFICDETKHLYAERGKMLYDPDKLKPKGEPRKLSLYGRKAQQHKALLPKKNKSSYVPTKEHIEKMSTLGHASQTQKAIKKRQDNPVYCVVCGKEIDWPVGKSRPRTCSDECLLEIKKRNMEKGREVRLKPIKCPICGNEFMPSRGHQKTCGDDDCIHQLKSKIAKEAASWKVPLANKARLEGLKNKPPKKQTENIVILG